MLTPVWIVVSCAQMQILRQTSRKLPRDEAEDVVDEGVAVATRDNDSLLGCSWVAWLYFSTCVDL